MGKHSSSLRCHRCREPYKLGWRTPRGKLVPYAFCAGCGTTFCLGFTGKEYLCAECAIGRLAKLQSVYASYNSTPGAQACQPQIPKQSS